MICDGCGLDHDLPLQSRLLGRFRVARTRWTLQGGRPAFRAFLPQRWQIDYVTSAGKAVHLDYALSVTQAWAKLPRLSRDARLLDAIDTAARREAERVERAGRELADAAEAIANGATS